MCHPLKVGEHVEAATALDTLALRIRSMLQARCRGCATRRPLITSVGAAKQVLATRMYSTPLEMTEARVASNQGLRRERLVVPEGHNEVFAAGMSAMVADTASGLISFIRALLKRTHNLMCSLGSRHEADPDASGTWYSQSLLKYDDR